MSRTRQQAAGHQAYLLHGRDTCPTCDGSGTVTSLDWISKARKGGNAAVEASKRPDQLSMSERGKLGGRPRLPRFEDGRLVLHPVGSR